MPKISNMSRLFLAVTIQLWTTRGAFRYLAFPASFLDFGSIRRLRVVYPGRRPIPMSIDMTRSFGGLYATWLDALQRVIRGHLWL